MLLHTSWTFSLNQTTGWHWSPNLECAASRGEEKHNHLPAIYIYMSNSTGVPSLRVKLLESLEEHFPPTELEYQCAQYTFYIKQPLFSKMM